MTASSDYEVATLKWENYFGDTPDFEQFKYALYEDLYKQFGIEAQVIRSIDEKQPILWVNINYDGQTPEVNNQEIIHNIYDINLALRTLSILRGLEYLYDKIVTKEEKTKYIKKLRNDYRDFLNDLRELHKQKNDVDRDSYDIEIELLEGKINAKFVAFLKKRILNNLPFEMTEKKFKKANTNFLSHIRYISSLLDPALAMQVIYNDTECKATTTYDIYPITQKTETQKKLIAEEEAPEEIKSTNDFIHWANVQFNSLLGQDTTNLPPLSRYTHLHTVKNGFIVQGKFEHKDFTKTWAYTRSAALAYIGQCTDDELKTSFHENLEQIRLNLKNRGITENTDFPFEILMLTTGSRLSNNHEAVATRRTLAHINEATTPNTTLSHNPMNAYGTLHRGNLGSETTYRAYGNKKYRAEQNADYVVECLTQGKLLNGMCASGVDRTTVVKSRADIKMELLAYHEAGIERDPIEIEKKYSLGLIGPMLSHLVCGGSYGLKPMTKTSTWDRVNVVLVPLSWLGINPTGDVFQETTNERFYYRTADKNRKRPVNRKDYDQAVLEKTIDSNEQESTTTEDEFIERGERAVERLLNNPYDRGAQFEYMRLIDDIAEAGKDYKHIGVILLTIFCLITAVAGILFLIPTGGSSAVFVTLGYLGLAATIGYSTSAIIGGVLMGASLISGLAAIFLHFKPPKELPEPLDENEYYTEDDDAVDLSVGV